MRFAAALVLSAHGDARAQEVVREALLSNDPKIQTTALEALRKLPAAADMFRPEIETLLKSADVTARRYAAELLIEGPSSDLAMEALIGLLAQAQPVAGILRKAGQAATAAIPALQKAVELGMDSAIPALCELAPPALLMQSLRQAMLHRKADVRAAAAEAIGNLGQAPDDVVERLRILSRDSDRDVRIAARAALVLLAMTPP
jgi:HEAT repeat protein